MVAADNVLLESRDSIHRGNTTQDSSVPVQNEAYSKPIWQTCANC